MTQVSLSPFALPERLEFRRNPPPRAVVVDQSFWTAYDQRTLFYDVFFDHHRRVVRLFAPRLFNLVKLLDRWCPRIDGRPVHAVKVLSRAKFDEIVLYCPGLISARRLSFELGDEKFEVEIGSLQASMFEQKNVICTLSKNNEIAWLRDWMGFHRRLHGADSLLIFDNDSTIYSTEELQQELSRVPGFTTVRVVSAKFLYGPQRGVSRGLGRSCFLQATLLNLARERFLSSARAVLSIDVDELVQSSSSQSVFDITARSPLGLVMFEGAWRYSVSQEWPSHRDHIWMREKDESCPSKYCYRPDSLLGRLTLDVHAISSVGRRWYPKHPDLTFAHCRSITTSWKEQRGTPELGLVVDDRLKNFWAPRS